MVRYDKSRAGYSDCCGKHEPTPNHRHDSETGRRTRHTCKAAARQTSRSVVTAALDEMEQERAEKAHAIKVLRSDLLYYQDRLAFFTHYSNGVTNAGLEVY